jgi:hypothetical protein
MKKMLNFCICSILLFGCEKEEVEIIDKSLLLGAWEKLEIKNEFCTKFILFDNSSYHFYERCGSRTTIGGKIPYKLSGKYITTIEDNLVYYEIVYLSSTLLKMIDKNGIVDEYRKP